MYLEESVSGRRFGIAKAEDWSKSVYSKEQQAGQHVWSAGGAGNQVPVG